VSSSHERLVVANPVPADRVAALVSPAWSEATLAATLSAASAGRTAPAPRLRLGRRWLVVGLAALALLALPAYAVARELIDGWLAGEPAPPSVATNFESYTPQLGFRPEPGRAVRVAVDRGVSLYATTNDRGTYCVATSTPDGGICVQPETAAAPLVAGLMPGDPARAHLGLVAVAGRAADPAARTIRFTDRAGDAVERPLGSSGFFIAVLPLRGSPCSHGDWRPAFEAVSEAGDVVATATITLVRQAFSSSGTPGCTWANGPHR
jgi:hypothetical protein